MSGSKVNNYSTTYTSITWMQLALDAQRKGFMGITLTNLSTFAAPAIEAGSVCEVSGALYSFSTEEAISTSNIVSTSYMNYFIELVPSSSQCTAQFSSVVPVWRASLNGFYETSTSEKRIIGVNTFSSLGHTEKIEFSEFFKNHVKVGLSSNFFYAVASSYKIPLNVKDYDPFQLWSTTNYSFTPNIPGFYHFIANFDIVPSSRDGMEIWAFDNASTNIIIYSNRQLTASITVEDVRNGSFNYYLSTNNSISFAFYENYSSGFFYGSNILHQNYIYINKI